MIDVFRSYCPAGYEEYSSRDAALTKKILALCSERNLEIYRVKRKSKGFWKVDGYHIPQGIKEEASKILAAKRGDLEAWKAKRREANQKREKRDIDRFLKVIKQLFPKIPNEDAINVANHACQVGSGRVGRARTICTGEAVDLAVRAHIRHTYTDYDDLLEKVDRATARSRIDSKIHSVLEQWQGT